MYRRRYVLFGGHPPSSDGIDSYSSSWEGRRFLWWNLDSSTVKVLVAMGAQTWGLLGNRLPDGVTVSFVVYVERFGGLAP